MTLIVRPSETRDVWPMKDTIDRYAGTVMLGKDLVLHQDVSGFLVVEGDGWCWLAAHCTFVGRTWEK